MAQVTFISPIESLSGQLSHQPNATIHRRKRYRDDKGHVIAEGVNETYVVVHPRDYSLNPPKGEELRNINIFRQAFLLSRQELSDPIRRQYWIDRWQRQRQRGEADAPISPTTNQPKIYNRLDRFVQSVLQRQLQAQSSPE